METYGDEKPHEFRWYHPSRWEQQISLEISWVIMGPLQIAVWSTPLLNEHEQTRTAAIITQKWGYSSTSTERERERDIYIYIIYTLCIYIYMHTGYIPTTHQPFQSHEPGVPGVPGPASRADPSGGSPSLRRSESYPAQLQRRLDQEVTKAVWIMEKLDGYGWIVGIYSGYLDYSWYFL